METLELLSFYNAAETGCFEGLDLMVLGILQGIRRRFPYRIDCLQGKDSISVLVDRGIYHRSLTVSIHDMTTGKVRVKNIAGTNARVLFEGLTCGRRYLLRITMGDMLRRCLYEPHELNLVFRGQRRLRIQGVGSGRCGTQSLAYFLDGLSFKDGTPVRARHETVAMTILNYLLRGERNAVADISMSYLHNAEVAPYFWFVPESITGQRILLLIRDGRKVVSSGMARGWFRRESIWDQVKPDYQGTLFEKCCRLWADSCAVLKPLSHVTIRLEDLCRSEATRRSLLDSLDISWSDKPFPARNISPLPVTLDWSAKEHEVFESICGKWMDEYYPGWRKTDRF